MENEFLRLSEYCDSVRDGTHDSPKPVEDGYYLVTSKNIKDGMINFSDCYKISSDDYIKINKRSKVDKYDILMTMIGTVGRLCIVKENTVDFAIKNVALLKINDINKSKWLYYYLSSKPVQDYFNAVANGTSQHFLGLGYLRNFKVPNFQDNSKRICDILSAYDELIEDNNKRIKILEQMAENLFKEWFVCFRFPGYETAEFENGIPKGWKEMKLEEFGISLDSGSRPSGGINSDLTEGIPSLGAESVNGLAEFDYNSVKYIPVEFFNKMKRGKNTGNDILVYKDGAYIGRTTIFRNDFPFQNYSVNEHVFLLNAQKDIYQNYLYFTLHQSAYFTLMQNLNRNAAQPGLSKPDMNRIKITVPEECVVEKFNGFVEPILTTVFKIARQNQNLIKQRDLLLPRLMSGKLEV